MDHAEGSGWRQWILEPRRGRSGRPTSGIVGRLFENKRENGSGVTGQGSVKFRTLRNRALREIVRPNPLIDAGMGSQFWALTKTSPRRPFRGPIRGPGREFANRLFSGERSTVTDTMRKQFDLSVTKAVQNVRRLVGTRLLQAADASQSLSGLPGSTERPSRHAPVVLSGCHLERLVRSRHGLSTLGPRGALSTEEETAAGRTCSGTGD